MTFRSRPSPVQVLSMRWFALGAPTGVASLALVACVLPPLPAPPARAVAPAPSKALSEALNRAARSARAQCPGRGDGEVRITADPAGHVSNVQVVRVAEVADVPCVEAAFQNATVAPFAGSPLMLVWSFRLDMLPSDAPPPVMDSPALNLQ